MIKKLPYMGSLEKCEYRITENPIEDIWHLIDMVTSEEIILEKSDRSVSKDILPFVTESIIQAQEFRDSAASCSEHTKPLQLYYCFHNLTKAVLALENNQVSPGYHGLKKVEIPSSGDLLEVCLQLDQGVFWDLLLLEGAIPKKDLLTTFDELLTRCVYMIWECEIAYSKKPTVLVPATIALGLTALSHPASSALTAESVEVRERGMAYSVTMFSFILPGVLTSAFGGWVADLFGYEILFLISIVLEGLSLSMLAFLLKETLHQRNKEKSMGRVSLKTILIPPSELRGFYISMATDAFSWGLGGAILFGLLSKTYNFSNLQLGILSSLTFLMWTASQLPIGKLIEKYGCKKFLILSEMIGIAMMIGWLTFTSFEVFALAALLYGLVASTWVPASQTLLSNSVKKEERAEAIGRLFAFRGIIGFPASYVGGLLYEAMGFKAPILAGAIGVVVTLILIALFVREPE